jgi:hypothetical protein
MKNNRLVAINQTLPRLGSRVRIPSPAPKSCRHIQPLRLTADAKAGRVHVFAPCARNETARRFGKAPATFRASAAHPGDGGGEKFHFQAAVAVISNPNFDTFLPARLLIGTFV